MIENMREKLNEFGKSLLGKIVVASAIILLLPILIVAALVYYSWGFILSIAIWIVWGFYGRNILFVYSDSPNWSGYIEENILPHIAKTAVILNWSERKQWKNSLAVLAFKLYGGSQNFNPMAIVFRPFRFHKIFRFYEAFKDFKHGKTESLEQTRMNLFKLI